MVTQSSAPAPKTVRRFRVNPVELAIFSMVSLIFLNSVYNLFYDRQGFHPTTLAPMAAKPTTEGRAPASTPAAATAAPTSAIAAPIVELKCEPTLAHETQSNKVRLSGKLCAPTAATAPKLNRVQVTNGTTQYVATVFTDLANGKFSTDYIELKNGKNDIAVEFVYPSAKVEQKVTVTVTPGTSK